MPALVIFGRRWQVGTDDFVYPGIIEILIRLAWLLGVLFVYLKNNAHFSCEGGYLLRNYLIGLLIIDLLLMIVTILLVYNSMQGTITDQRARRHVPKLLYIRIFLVVPEVVWNALGSAWAFSSSVQCSDEPIAVLVVKALIICNWVIFAFLALGIVLAFDPIGSHSFLTAHDEEAPDFFLGESPNVTVHHSYRKLWEWRFQLLWCCSGLSSDENNAEAFHNLAVLFSSVFGEYDMVPSDMAAGLIIVHLKEKLKRQYKRKESVVNGVNNGTLRLDVGQRNGESSPQPESAPSTCFTSLSELPSPLASPVCTPDLAVTPDLCSWMSPQLAYHYANFAMGSYGWPLYFSNHTCTGLCRIWSQLTCCTCCKTRPSFIVDDNCCYCHSAALKKGTGLTDDDLIYVSFRNRICQVPFYIAVDHKMKSIVVCIRGSLSLRDGVTDLILNSETLDMEGIPEGCIVHKGMLDSARFVKRQIEESGALNHARSLYQNYNLVITGHSLGAGVAVVLAMILHPIYPDLRCFGFATPRATTNHKAAQFAENFVLTILVGDDCIPRLCLSTFQMLKRKIVTELTECSLPKYRILARGFCCLMGGTNLIENLGTNSDASRSSPTPHFPLLAGSPVKTTHTYESLAEVSRRLQKQESNNGTGTTGVCLPSCVPGRILHIAEKKSYSSRERLTEPIYEVRWASHEDFSEIVVTPSMFMHHLPDAIIEALRLLLEQSENQFWGVSVQR